MQKPIDKERASRNRTIILDDQELNILKGRCITIDDAVNVESILNKTIHGDTFKILEFLPKKFIDLVFVDPPYNLSKTFNSNTFKEMEYQEYIDWLDTWIGKLAPLLKPTASLYICGDWKSSPAIFTVLNKYFIIQNRIAWEREKGRGAKRNWKNCSEDIWFCTVSKKYHFDVDAVKSKRKVIAPYKNANGDPKDWQHEENGKYRLTHPSNFWTDISVPFWSMPENTDHPTQKPEKLIAKAILASSKPGDVVFDPFLGSGTTSVVAKKLNRAYVGVELDEFYCCLAEKRIEMAGYDNAIQGYVDGVFWERNTANEQNSNGYTDGSPLNTYFKQESIFADLARI